MCCFELACTSCTCGGVLLVTDRAEPATADCAGAGAALRELCEAGAISDPPVLLAAATAEAARELDPGPEASCCGTAAPVGCCEGCTAGSGMLCFEPDVPA